MEELIKNVILKYTMIKVENSEQNLLDLPVVEECWIYVIMELIWDEYMANILALQGEDKKKTADVMNKVSEILMLGRSLGVRFICSCQRPDAKAFPDGSRLNYGIIMILGAPMRSIYEMLMPKEYIEMVEDRQFERGEGILLLQGSDLHFVKIPTVRDMEKMQEICVKALS